jgi:pSer/pThr/pTyr-binding forkhead associated (FHA) protein
MLDKTLANVTQQIYSPNADADATATTRLFVLAGPLVGASFALADGETTVGRSPECSIQLSTPGVSRTHCRITTEGGKSCVEDLGSSNGTVVNGRELQPQLRTELQHGDRIKVLDSEFFFLSPQATADAAENELDVNFHAAASEAGDFLAEFPELLDIRQRRRKPE